VLGNQLAAELQAPVMFGMWVLDSGDVRRTSVALRRTLKIRSEPKLYLCATNQEVSNSRSFPERLPIDDKRSDKSFGGLEKHTSFMN